MQNYVKEGFCHIEGVLDASLLQRVGERLDRAALGELDQGIRVQREPALGDRELSTPLDEIRKVMQLVRHDEFFRELACHESILKHIYPVLGRNIRFFGDEAQLKPALHGSAHVWHQDAPYFHSKPLPVATLWMAIDDATVANGCLEVIAGAHKAGIIGRDDTDKPWLDEGFDISNSTPVEVKKGNGILFDLLLPHGSGPNRTAHRRRSMILRYIDVDRLTPDQYPLVEHYGHVMHDAPLHPIFAPLSTPHGRFE